MTDIFSDPDEKNLFQIDDTKAYLSELVGDGKKFKDNEVLARAKLQSDHFITVLQRENQELREDLKQRVTMKDVLDQLQRQEITKGRNDEENQPPAEDQTPVLKKEDLTEYITKAMQEQRDSDAKARNQTSVTQSLAQLYGSEEAAQAQVSQKAKELGLTTETVKKMAQESPKAFLELFKKQDRPENLTPPMGQRSQLDPRFVPGAPKTQTQWSEIRKQDKLYYHSEKAAIQRHTDAMALGEAYFDKKE